jgi:hypothetical protein
MIWPLKPRRAVPIDPETWGGLRARLPWLARLGEAESERMRDLVAQFLSRKTFTGTHGLVPDDGMRLTIAAQACLPVLHLGLAPYEDFVEIVVYPSAFAVRRSVTDDDGLVHEFDDVLSGEAMHQGPVVLSWEDVAADADDACANVVIHEFAHKLDLSDGEADGCPPMPAARRAAWLDMLGAAYDDFVGQVERLEDSMPADLDPEGEDADAWYARLPLDPYAATDEVEFFAVACEAFFVDPHRLADAFPELYASLAHYYRMDPAGRGDTSAA